MWPFCFSVVSQVSVKETMAEEFSVRHTTKFDGTNFQAWKFQMRHILISYNVYDLVMGTRARPALPGDNDNAIVAENKWVRDNSKAMSLIATTMEPSQMEYLLTCETAAEMWMKLSNIHEQKTASNKFLLAQKFHEYRMNPTDSVVQHVAKLQNMARQLSDIGENVSDVHVMSKILGSLPSKYNALRTAWDSVDPERQTINYLQERLIKEESRLTVEDETTSAFAAISLSKHKQGKTDMKNGSNSQSNKKTVFECYYCKKKGHYARDCRKRKRDRKDDRGQSRQRDDSGNCAFVATASSHGGETRNSAPSNEQVAYIMNLENSEVWITDSGASRHITYRRDWFSVFRSDQGETISLGDDGECEVKGSGTILIEKFVDNQWQEARIENVLYVPKVRKNLFSVGVCTNKGFDVLFKGQCVVIKRDNQIVAQGIKQNNDIYRLLIRVRAPQVFSEANVTTTDLKTLHERMGHVNKRTIREMTEKGVVQGIKLSSKTDFFCEPCQLGKSHRLPFKQKEAVKGTKPGEFFHTDVGGPMSVESLGGAKFYVIFKDDASEFRHIYFIKHKSDVYEKFKDFEKMVSNKFGHPMKAMRCDNGTEYCNRAMEQYLRSRGIRLETTAPHTPQQNGKSERDNRTIVESARTMLHAKDMPLNLWAEALNTAVYILNRTPTSNCPTTTPYETWTGKKPCLSHLRIFGSQGYLHIPKALRKKLDPQSRKILLVGYQGESSNYRVYDPKTKRVSVSRDVVFNEELQKTYMPAETFDCDLPSILDSSGMYPVNDYEGPETKVEQLPLENDPGCAEQPPGQGAAQGDRPAGRLRDRETLRRPQRYELNIAVYNTPLRYQEAVEGPDADKWVQAVQNELEAHRKNETWTIVPRMPGRNTIDSKWVFKIQDECGKPSRFKARLCARGFLQREGVDYTETFAPVVRYDSLRVLLAMVAQKDLELIQFDVKTAFLNGELKEEIYMEVPEGLVINEDPAKVVCKLRRSLYGLKQAPRSWSDTFREFLKPFNFKASEADSCIFHGVVSDSDVYLALFVDDGLVASKSKTVLDLVVKSLQKHFEITLGDARCFVGLQIERDCVNKTMFIHQNAYVRRIIDKFCMNDAKAVNVPADPNVVLEPRHEDDVKSNVPYREAVGSLTFLAIVSRPDIAFAVSTVSRYLSNFNDNHWQAVKRIFKYLVGTSNVGIMYSSGGSESHLIGFSDADYARDLETRRSVSGYAFNMANGIVTWSSQRQKLVTLSTTEAEYVAAAAAAKEATWLRKLLSDIGYQSDIPTCLFVDNQSSIRLIKNPVFHKRTKHIDIRYHYIREQVENGEISVEYISTDLQRADIFTKPLPYERLHTLCESLGLVNRSAKHSNGGSVGI